MRRQCDRGEQARTAPGDARTGEKKGTFEELEGTHSQRQMISDRLAQASGHSMGLP
jgi:hypothetical protein